MIRMLVLEQEHVVDALQRRVLKECAETRTIKSGELKDIAVALGVAVDKLEVLCGLAARDAAGAQKTILA